MQLTPRFDEAITLARELHASQRRKGTSIPYLSHLLGVSSLVLADDGALTGTDGCNRLVGTWTADADTIAFVDVASTRMACEGVDTWLSGLATGTIADETLTVFDESGEKIGTLERSE